MHGYRGKRLLRDDQSLLLEAHMTPRIVEVNTGEIKSGEANMSLRANALGSCIALCVYSRSTRKGGLAHIMLPGKAPVKAAQEKFRYMNDAVRELVRSVWTMNISLQDCIVCIAGGGNVLKREDDTICAKNI